MSNYTNGLKILYSGLKALDIEISKNQEEQLIKYYEMLFEKNKVMNLTAITEFDEVIIKHFLDSVSLVKVVDKQILNSNISMIDVGTGAGFPGIPLKIVFPNINLLLLDSLNKRLKFLEEVTNELQLTNVKTVHGRSEDIAQSPQYREQFDICVSRAVANLSTLSELCLGFVKVDGHFISYKAGESESEIENSKFAINILGGKIQKVVEFSLPNSELTRVFVDIKKVKKLNKNYPRKAGTPAKEPLNK
jgi:16S rRNA (guanine527-N7)-methyltransferase